MAYVEVYVDLADLETEELCDELVKRFNLFGRRKLEEKEKAALRSAISELVLRIGMNFSEQITVKSVEDTMKMELLNEVWSKYTYWQLSELLKK